MWKRKAVKDLVNFQGENRLHNMKSNEIHHYAGVIMVTLVVLLLLLQYTLSKCSHYTKSLHSLGRR